MNGNVREREMTRRAGESFLVGDAVEIRIDRIEGDRARLRIWAPDAAAVAPRETVEEVASENRKAALSRIPGLDDLCILEEGSAP